MSCWCRSISSVLKQNGIGGYGCRAAKSKCCSNKTVSQDPTSSAGSVNSAQLAVSIDTIANC
ncbi:hypothetical protein F2Q69_00036336 [Brassica cretica]|uniref:Uncharacterized protein n=1 Tax=Brassica cretica TaxID=69181 RepID=A0A8S9SMG2_BRACR|nr:hypothetical protein F2Q69_00036336 [Brassica cretica]